jgi:hypothetical protein
MSKRKQQTFDDSKSNLSRFNPARNILNMKNKLQDFPEPDPVSDE